MSSPSRIFTGRQRSTTARKKRARRTTSGSSQKPSGRGTVSAAASRLSLTASNRGYISGTTPQW